MFTPMVRYLGLAHPEHSSPAYVAPQHVSLDLGQWKPPARRDSGRGAPPPRGLCGGRGLAELGGDLRTM